MTEDGVFEQAMYESKLESLPEFFKDVSRRGVQEKRNRDRFFRVEIGGEGSIVVPAQSIYHDILNHGVKEQEYVSVIESLKNPDNTKEANISYRKNQYSGKSVILLVEANKREYAVCIDVGTSENRITSLYKTTKDGYAEQVKKGLSERRHPNNPTGSSPVTEDVRTDKPFTDIIGESASKINTGKNGVDAWMRKEASAVPSSQLTATNGENANSVTTRGKPLKDIISEVKKEINTPLEQRKAVRRGMYSQAENLIRLTKDADFSTLPHELAHFWLTEQETWANTKSASDEYVDAFNQALNWLGVKDGKTIDRRAQEQFARGYEQYLLDGNLPRTPDSDILPTYRRYDRWLKRVYDAMNQPSKKPLTEEIVRFFQSMTTGSLPTVLPVAASIPEREKDARENAENIGKDATPQIDFKSAVFNLSDERRAHIEKHLGQIKCAGFDGVDDYIGYISENYDAVYADPDLPERYWFTVTESGNHNNLMVVEAIKNEKTGGVDIITASPHRKRAFKNKKNLLSGGAQSNHSQGIPQNEALTGQKQIYENNISSNDAFVNRPSASSPTVVRSDELFGAYWKPAAAQENANGKVSRAQERQNRLNRLNGLLSEDAVSTTYEAAHLADASQKAVNLIETRGIDAARKMIDGEVPTEDGVLRTALMIEYEQKMLAEGNVEEYTRVLRLHTLEQTRRGQEISAEKLNQDITNPAYWFKRVLLLRKNNLPKNIVANMPEAASLDGRIDKFVSQTDFFS